MFHFSNMTNAVRIGILGFALFGVIQVTSAAAQPKDLVMLPSPKGPWTESEVVTQSGTFACANAKAEYNLTIDAKRGITQLSASVAGQAVPSSELERVKREINANRGFDFVFFICSDDTYSLNFQRSDTSGKGADVIITTSGKIPGAVS